ncbi:MAG: XDD3 family exosortase-dependent surface protein [Prochlorotrichaceae cyanobacterium]|jgi:hypothetical protein
MQQANLQLNLQSNLQKVIQGTIAAGVVCLAGQSAQAGTLYQGWNYAIDSFNDGYNNGTIGAASNYELYGLAVKQAGNQVTFAINSDTPLGGFYSSTASGNRIAYGDLFLNFTGQTLANAQGNLFGIRFDDQSDNSAGFSLGLYSGVLAQKVSLFNNGFNTLSQHRNSVANKGGTASLGDLAQNSTNPYFSNQPLNSIRSGTKVASLTALDSTALAGLGLNFGHFGATGTYTFGFSVDRSALPSGNFLAHLFVECANDGVALAGTLTEDVPEPAGVLGMALVGLMGSAGWLRRKLGLSA